MKSIKLIELYFIAFLQPSQKWRIRSSVQIFYISEFSSTEKGVPRFLTKTAKRKRPPNLSKSTFQNPNEGTLTPWTSYRVISTNRLKYLRPFGFKRLRLFSILFPKKASWAIFAKCLFPHMGKINHLKKTDCVFLTISKYFFQKAW